jgi:oligopeptide transport system substrate-binding protein
MRIATIWGRLLMLGAVLIVALVLVSGMAGAQDAKVLRTSFLSGDVPTLDPALAEDNTAIQVLEATYIGLTTLSDVDASTEAGIASDWSVSEDGLTYTFNIIPEIPWVRYNPDSGQVEQIMDENGSPRYVTAQDVVYGWKRTLDPATGSPYAATLAPWVVGGVEFLNGEGSADDVQVVAVDDYTLEVTTPTPGVFVPAIYGLWMARPQPQWAIEEFGADWIEAGNHPTYGPFALKEWLHDESLTITRNPFWPGTDTVPQAKLDDVVFTMLDESVQLANFEAGTQDAIIQRQVPASDIPRIQSDPVLSEMYNVAPDYGILYYGFNVEKPPFDNVHMRRAFSYATDRQAIVDNVVRGGQEPAHWFSRPGLVAAPTLETNPDLGIFYDLDKAREELQLALDEMGLASVDELPPITLMHNDSDIWAQVAQATQQMWAENLGIEVQIASMEWAVYLDTLENDAPQIWRIGWGIDYPDAHNYLYDVFHSTSENNYTNWTSPEFDALVEEAALLTDTEARRELYVQAEQMLVYDNAALLPIYWNTNPNLTQPYVVRTYSVSGNERFEKWDIQQ